MMMIAVFVGGMVICNERRRKNVNESNHKDGH